MARAGRMPPRAVPRPAAGAADAVTAPPSRGPAPPRRLPATPRAVRAGSGGTATADFAGTAAGSGDAAIAGTAAGSGGAAAAPLPCRWQHRLCPPLPAGRLPANPSVAWDAPAGAPAALRGVLRCAAYTVDERGYHSYSKLSGSVTIPFTADRGGAGGAEGGADARAPGAAWGPLLGVDLDDHDLRLFTAGGRLWATGSRSLKGARFAVMLIALEAGSGRPDPALRVLGVWRLTFLGEAGAEKNWMPFEHAGALYFVRSVAPDFCVLRLRGGLPEPPGGAAAAAATVADPPLLACEVVHRRVLPGHGELRGNAAPLRLPPGAAGGAEDPAFLLVVHARLGITTYRNHFALLRVEGGGGPAFSFALGPPFTFGASLEYISGLAWAEGPSPAGPDPTLLVAYGVHDREAWVAGAPLAAALRGLAAPEVPRAAPAWGLALPPREALVHVWRQGGRLLVCAAPLDGRDGAIEVALRIAGGERRLWVPADEETEAPAEATEEPPAEATEEPPAASEAPAEAAAAPAEAPAAEAMPAEAAAAPAARRPPHGFPRRLLRTFPADDPFYTGPVGRRCLDSWRELNPGWEILDFHHADREDFLAAHYPAALPAYRALVPGAYQADLWRYCALFVLGGVYVDAKCPCLRPLDGVLRPGARAHLLQDSAWCGGGVSNGLMAVAPGHPLLEDVIAAVCRDVAARHYGEHTLDITGPALFGRRLRAFAGAGAPEGARAPWNCDDLAGRELPAGVWLTPAGIDRRPPEPGTTCFFADDGSPVALVETRAYRGRLTAPHYTHYWYSKSVYR